MTREIKVNDSTPVYMRITYRCANRISFRDKLLLTMRGRQYSSFDAFREDFWKTVADSRYASEFSKSDIEGMRKGLAPEVSLQQRYGKLKSYVLHHEKPIHAGGGVYDLDNIKIVTPRMHQEILNKEYHFGH